MNILALGQKVKTNNGYEGEVWALNANDQTCLVRINSNSANRPWFVTTWIPQSDCTVIEPKPEAAQQA